MIFYRFTWRYLPGLLYGLLLYFYILLVVILLEPHNELIICSMDIANAANVVDNKLDKLPRLQKELSFLFW